MASSGADFGGPEETNGDRCQRENMATVKNRSLYRNNITFHCSSVVREFAVGKKIRCNVCVKDISVRGSFACMMNHLNSIHFRREIYQCRYCSEKFTCSERVRRHVNLVHGRSATDGYYDNSDQYEAEIIDWIKKCYVQPDGAQLRNTDSTEEMEECESEERESDTEERSSRRDQMMQISVNDEILATVKNRNLCRNNISFYCSSVTRERIFNNKIRCNVCVKDISAGIQLLIDHVNSIHVRQKMYHCRICSKGLTSYYNIISHLRRVHNRSATNGYVNNSDQYEAEIIEWIKKCYAGESAGAQESDDNGDFTETESGQVEQDDEEEDEWRYANMDEPFDDDQAADKNEENGADPISSVKPKNSVKSETNYDDQEYSDMANDQPSTSAGTSQPVAERGRNEYKCDKCPYVTENPVWMVLHVDYHIDIAAYRLKKA